MSLVVDGSWPGPMTITRGWSRAAARRWNDESEAGYLRLFRGGSDFLSEASALVAGHGDGVVYSPALYPSSARPWRRAGYDLLDNLLVMERAMTGDWPQAVSTVQTHKRPAWGEITRVDAEAFEGFWRMDRQGLADSAAATSRGIVLTVTLDAALVGYAIVGADSGLAYLQRIAVAHSHTRRGIGSDLMSSALSWARNEGSRAMLLNVRPTATAARGLYRSFGFKDTSTRLEILVYR